MVDTFRCPLNRGKRASLAHPEIQFTPLTAGSYPKTLLVIQHLLSIAAEGNMIDSSSLMTRTSLAPQKRQPVDSTVLTLLSQQCRCHRNDKDSFGTFLLDYLVSSAYWRLPIGVAGDTFSFGMKILRWRFPIPNETTDQSCAQLSLSNWFSKWKHRWRTLVSIVPWRRPNPLPIESVRSSHWFTAIRSNPPIPDVCDRTQIPVQRVELLVKTFSMSSWCVHAALSYLKLF